MKSTHRFVFRLALVSVLALTATLAVAAGTSERPNILIAITDDHSWLHTSAQGSPFLDTPNIDSISQRGIHFNNAYAGSPGCSPSRAALLSGQHHWMIGPAGTHGSTFPVHYEVYVDVLEDAGYKVGYTGKGWGPGDWYTAGRTRSPAGDPYKDVDHEPDEIAVGINQIVGILKGTACTFSYSKYIVWLNYFGIHR